MIIVLLFTLPTWMLFGGYAAFVVFCGVILVQILMELGEERRINALRRWDRDNSSKPPLYPPGFFTDEQVRARWAARERTRPTVAETSAASELGLKAKK